MERGASFRISLPIDARIDEIVATVAEASRDRGFSRTLLIASPGSGKTTRVPWALSRALSGKVYVLEPRRIAAKLSAERVAQENGVTLGGEVGYQFRFERKRRDDSRLVFLTEGTLLRELAGNPELRGVEVIVLDEFHERHLQADLALAIAKRLQETSRPDLRILVMSATLDPAPLEAFLTGARRIEIDAARFPIEVEYRPRESPSAFGLEKDVRRAVENLLARPDAGDFGDLLVFLPGMAEIRRAEAELRGAFGGRADVLPLHGELSPDEQSRALGRGARRKIILSTNIAESSVTIPGVNTIVDGGLARIASHSHATGLPRLETKPISRASAIQRAGRAGRTGPGRVVRLYSKGDFEGRPMQETPEILRTDLAPVLLDLATLGVFPGFGFFETPSPERVSAGWNLLRDLGLVEGERDVTEFGKLAGAFPFHPRVARAVIESARLGLEGEARERTFAALIAIAEGEDLGLDFLEGARRFRVSGFQTRIRDRLADAAARAETRVGLRAARKPESVETSVARAVLAGFHDRVGKRIEKSGEPELLLARGGSVGLSKDAFWTHAELFLVLDLQESKRAGDLRARTSARSGIAIEEAWVWDVEPLPIRERVEREFDERKKKWMEVESFELHDLTLSRTVREAAVSASGVPEALPVAEWERLYGAWLADLRHGLGERDGEASPRVAGRTDAEAWDSLETRYRLLRETDPGEGLEPESFGDLLRNLLFAQAREARSSRDFPDLDSILREWTSAALRKFRDRTPTFVSLPGRARVPVHYGAGMPAKIESRIQDFFGLTEGPRILGGHRKLSLHLLAPNYRAFQVTEDLKGFWERHYPTARRELMRRYPRHAWPENPLIQAEKPARLDDGGNRSHRVKK